MQITFKENMRNEQGFSLVELAIVLIIFGLVISTVALGYRMYYSGQSEDRTIEAIEQSFEAAFEFRFAYGRYPCPADPTLGPNDPNYGRENCNPNTSNVTRVVGFRDADNADNDGDPDTGRDNVLIGTFPFETIWDPENDAPDGSKTAHSEYVKRFGFDAWNNKLAYAVSENLTSAATFNDRNGVIDVIHENTFNEQADDNATLLGQRGSAHLVIISHGETGDGAYNRNGALVENCAVSSVKQTDIDNGLAVQPDETTNCHNLDAIFLSGLRNEGDRSPFDDYIKFMTVSKASLWEHSGIEFIDHDDDPSTPDLEINKVTNTNSGNIGVGINDPDEKLHIDGEVQAFEVHAVGLCDESGNDCMDPLAIAGELANMQCPPGQVVISIEQNTVNCANPFGSASLTGTCPSGTFLKGFSNVSGIICE